MFSITACRWRRYLRVWTLLFTGSALAGVALANSSDAPVNQHWPQLSHVLEPLVLAAAAQEVRLAIGVQDLRESDSRVALVGSTESYHPASTIKMLLIAALMARVDAGTLALHDTVMVTPHDIVGGYGVLQHEDVPQQVSLARLAELTVTISDNTATNVLVDAVGYDTLRSLAQTLGLQTMHFGRKMFEAPSPPDHDNFINAADTLVLLSEIYADSLLSASSRQQVIAWMEAQTVGTKIAAGVPAGTRIAHKTGENGPVSHDIGYLLLPGREVAIAIFAEVIGSTDFDAAQSIANPIVANVAAVVHAFVLGQ